jgi:hypothetical protein
VGEALGDAGDRHPGQRVADDDRRLALEPVDHGLDITDLSIHRQVGRRRGTTLATSVEGDHTEVFEQLRE